MKIEATRLPSKLPSPNWKITIIKKSKPLKYLRCLFPKILKDHSHPFNDIITLGVPVAQLNSIISRVENLGKERIGGLFISLRKALLIERKSPKPNFSKILAGLESKDEQAFLTAEHLIDEIDRFTTTSAKDTFKYPGLNKADVLLQKFTLAEIGELIKASRWSGGFLNTLYAIHKKAPGFKISDISQLAQKLGRDIDLLLDIIEPLDTKTLDLKKAEDAIEKSKKLAEEIDKLMSDPNIGIESMAKLVWGDNASVLIKDTPGGKKKYQSK
ncbi:MAG: hypothetical protein HC880_03745 [Bacteroidia bacterium]|nr:hypothetical protein [Bacteroidia bacterium]